MQRITDIKELQAIELGILEDIAAFCDAHGIRYTLSGGTLLGAIRNKGFIPWDDDADMAMLRPDYDRFVREYRSSRFKLLSIGTGTYAGTYAKVIDPGTVVREKGVSGIIGVWVDVFPLDGAPRRGYCPLATSGFWRRYRSVLKYRNHPLLRDGASAKALVLSVLALPLRLVPNRILFAPILRNMRRHSVDSSPFVGFIGGSGYTVRETVPRTVVDSFVPVSFEGRTFSAMKGWDEYLSSLYGDYMTPPPPEKRKPIHPFQAWRL